jgi:hypothetical protein
MGLTIHHKLSVAENLSVAVVCELILRTALYARKIGCAEVGEVTRVEADPPSLYLHLAPASPRNLRNRHFLDAVQTEDRRHARRVHRALRFQLVNQTQGPLRSAGCLNLLQNDLKTSIMHK